MWLHVKKMHNRKGTHADVEVFEDELKQMQAMELVRKLSFDIYGGFLFDAVSA